MKKKLFFVITALITFLCVPQASAKEASIGSVNFKACFTASKMAKQEYAIFSKMKQQETEKMDESVRKLEAVLKKLEDQDYLDSLSNDGRQQLKQETETLQENLENSQNLYQQKLQQANQRMWEGIHAQICIAAEQVREKNQLLLILNQDCLFAIKPTLDFTGEVIREMDELFQESQSLKDTQ